MSGDEFDVGLSTEDFGGDDSAPVDLFSLASDGPSPSSASSDASSSNAILFLGDIQSGKSTLGSTSTLGGKFPHHAPIQRPSSMSIQTCKWSKSFALKKQVVDVDATVFEIGGGRKLSKKVLPIVLNSCVKQGALHSLLVVTVNIEAVGTCIDSCVYWLNLIEETFGSLVRPQDATYDILVVGTHFDEAGRRPPAVLRVLNGTVRAIVSHFNSRFNEIGVGVRAVFTGLGKDGSSVTTELFANYLNWWCLAIKGVETQPPRHQVDPPVIALSAIHQESMDDIGRPPAFQAGSEYVALYPKVFDAQRIQNPLVKQWIDAYRSELILPLLQEDSEQHKLAACDTEVNLVQALDSRQKLQKFVDASIDNAVRDKFMALEALAQQERTKRAVDAWEI